MSEGPGKKKKKDGPEPGWSEQFPIGHGNETIVTRRGWVRLMVIFSGALFVGQLWMALFPRRRKPPAPEEIASLDDLPVGSVKAFEFPERGETCLLVRLSETELRAYTQRCTHLGCPVVPMVGQKQFVCPCHAGVFDMTTGAVVSGPPTRPLPRVTLEIRGRKVIATAMQEP